MRIRVQNTNTPCPTLAPQVTSGDAVTAQRARCNNIMQPSQRSRRDLGYVACRAAATALQPMKLRIGAGQFAFRIYSYGLDFSLKSIGRSLISCWSVSRSLGSLSKSQ